MKIQPKYYIWASTPLKYYKFSVYFVLIFGALTHAYQGIKLLNSGDYLWIDVLYCFLMTAWLIYIEIQLADRKWRGAVAYCACYIFRGIYGLFLSILFISYNLPAVQFLSDILSSFIIAPILWTYFSKRRPLFSPWAGQQNAATSDTTPKVWTESPVFVEEAEESKQDPSAYSEPSKSHSAPEPASPSLQQRIMASRERIYRCCPQCGQLVPYIQMKCDCGYRFLSRIPKASKKELPRLKIITVALGVLCLLLCATLAFSYSSAQSSISELAALQEELEEVNAELKKLQTENKELSGSLSVTKLRIQLLNGQLEDAEYNTFVLTILVGALVESDDYFHHTPQCTAYEENTGAFWFYPVTLLAELGYSPCPDCHTSSEIMKIHDLIEIQSAYFPY